ncbi:hypothetical protein HM1_2706 [Heliomicrobium modesticaldum Ice1]|uniref:SpoOB alpha-helical domain-containing protein n=1 Tax=Heliobacterium modesticaldum (strain ATCC 51547 / Ice1) TaxID=498761 RepID=B0TBW2_HELMI|nr:Spo0B domain-containing protein [Heliomicrobium modesticaldum]ABZ85235.1 hypothetical protein HM1_2706 [Heliomicrobium modesticaldum Ice1]
MVESGFLEASDRSTSIESCSAEIHLAGFSPDAPAWVKLWRELRHDFINHLQTILGYIQVGRGERSLEYLRHVAQQLQEAGSIMTLGILPVIAHLLLKGQELREQAIHLRVQVDRGWEPRPWQVEHKARRLASVASAAIESLLPTRDQSEEEPVLCLRFCGPEPILKAYWLDRDETMATITLSAILRE